MQIALVTHGLEFDGSALETRSLGGSETALLCVARELAKLGNDVRVYCQCDNPGIYDGVQYHHHQSFLMQNRFNDLDVLVCSRYPQFLAAPVNAGLRVLWCHDIAPDAESAKSWVSPLYQTDMLMLLSEYHREDFRTKIPELDQHVWLTSNGVDLDLIESNIKPKVPGKLFYSSRPERGLINLLQHTMPNLAQSHPDARLYVCTYDLSSLPSPTGPVADLYRECTRLANELPNVVPMQPLTKSQLYQHMSSSELLLYPTDFPEISCITAMESQACGTPMITTDDFALSETLGDKSGYKITLQPSDPGYHETFLETTRAWLDSPDVRSRAEQHGKQFVRDRGYSWSAVAKSWQEEFSRRMSDRVSRNKQAIYKTLRRKNDSVAASIFAKKNHIPEVGGSPVVNETVASQVRVSKALPMDQVTSAFREALQGRYTQGLELLKYLGHEPKRVLDFRSGSVSAGIAYSRWIPSAEVEILADDEEVAAQLRKHLEVRDDNSTKVVVSEQDLGDDFDVLILDEVLDASADPQATVDRLQKKFLNPGGVVLAFNRFGTDDTIYEDKPASRKWNFSLSDLQDMFGLQDEYASSVHCSDSLGKIRTNDIGEAIGHFISVFRPNGTRLGKMDLTSRFNRTRPYQSVGVCMVASNEEDWISGAIKSVVSIADSVQVVVNNSDDGTRSICESLGAKVKNVEFDNFAQIRNESITGMESDWILWIDADERLVNPGNTKKYLEGAFFNGFAIRQNHLMIDLAKSFDLPIRLYRNDPNYRFTGYIHEHCEDTANNPFDDPIAPTLMLPDVDIAHYGYLNERMRRYKCSARNLSLLLRDVQDNGEHRVLTWVLVMRDYLNLVKWSFEKQGNPKIQRGSFEHACVHAAIATWANHLEGTGHRYEDLGRPMYQEALQMLGANGLPVGNDQIPFEIGLSLFGAVSGVEDSDIKPQTIWFRSGEEYTQFVDFHKVNLGAGLGVIPSVNQVGFVEKFDEPPHAELLAKGLNVVDKAS